LWAQAIHDSTDWRLCFRRQALHGFKSQVNVYVFVCVCVCERERPLKEEISDAMTLSVE